jgi:hypothetical protein
MRTNLNSLHIDCLQLAVPAPHIGARKTHSLLHRDSHLKTPVGALPSAEDANDATMMVRGTGDVSPTGPIAARAWAVDAAAEWGGVRGCAGLPPPVVRSIVTGATARTATGLRTCAANVNGWAWGDGCMGMGVAVEAAIDAGAEAAMVWPGSRDGVTGAAPLEAVARGGVNGATKVVVVAVAEVAKVAVAVATPTGCARGNAVTGVANSTLVRPATVA